MEMDKMKHHCCCYSKTVKSEERSDEDGLIVLGVSVHCQGCEYTIRECLWSMNGVESVEVYAEKNLVKVKGKKVDAAKVAKKLRKKTGKIVEVISPKLWEDKKAQIKKKEPTVVEVQLRLYLHCHGCVKDVKKCLHKFPGVQSLQLDMEKNVCKVKGTVNPKKLVEYLEDCTGKKAEIVKTNELDDKQHQQQHEYLKKICYESAYYAPNLDSVSAYLNEENANSCSVM